MKKVVYIMLLVMFLILFYLTKGSNLLALTFSFGMYIVFNSLFFTVNIKSNNYRLFKMSIISVLIIGAFLALVSFFLGSILNVEKLDFINVVMVISLLCNILLKMIRDYLGIIGYKKLNSNILNIYYFINILLKIILFLLCFGVFKIDNNIGIILFYCVDIGVFIIISILLYIMIFRNIKKYDNDKVCYKEKIKNILVGNDIVTIYNIIMSSYIYTSMIILYYVFINKYNYTLDSVNIYLTNTYLYGLIIVFIMFKLINKYLNINIKENFNINFNKIIRILLTIIILFIIISKPINYLIFDERYNAFANLMPLLFMFIFYNFIINTNINYNKKKNIVISLIIGLVIKLIFEMPFIDAVYRMGFSLVLGDILSIVLGLVVSCIIGVVLIKNKLKISLLDNFNNILQIIYENIIYTLIIVLFTFVVKVDTNSVMSSMLVIVFYIFITILFIVVKKKLKCK